ncbi:MAG: hypothetical protein R3292_08120 [Alcanivorax sp.]|nr:hypothetical protein [Alcanivorax sp.]
MGNHKKLLPLALAMALAACGGGSNSVPDQSVGATKVGTHPVFNPAAGQLPLNTDLVFAGSTDGTADVGAATNPVTAALNKLDGFSTSAYFDIAFDGGSLDPASLCTPADAAGSGCVPNVFLVPLSTSGDALSGTVTGPDTALADQPAYSASVVSLDGGKNNVLRITPSKPLLSKTKYLVFVTNGVKDSGAKSVQASFQYDLLGGPDDSSLVDSLQAVQGAIHGWESLASAILTSGNPDSQAAKDSVVISYTFTTTDPITPLVAMGAPRAALMQQITKEITKQLLEANPGLDPSQAQSQAQTQAKAVVGNVAAYLPTPQARDLDVSAMSGVDLKTLSGGKLPAAAGNLYTGYIKLPYYLSAPATATDYAFLQKSWSADTALAGQLGQTVPADADGSYNVTYRYPFAAQTGVEDVPLQVTLPMKSLPSGSGTCGDLQTDTGSGVPGYPVVIYVHGITSDRSSVIALANALALKCIATVAIDLPMHGVPANSDLASVLNVEHGVNPVNGKSYSEIYPDNAPHERHFEVVQDASGNPVPMNFSSPTALDGSGSWFINLANLANTRDNLRESVMDLMNLNASLGKISNLNIDGNGTFDLSNVKVVGVSLGGIVGTVFASANQQAIGALQKVNSQTGTTFTSNLNSLKGLLVSSGGSQVTQILNHSPTFAPRIKAGLAAAGVNEGSSDYEKFLYAAQSMVASGDPVNFAQPLVALSGVGLGMPVLVQQIVGGGDVSAYGDTTVYLPDQVVPNSAAGAPLAGVTPLAGLLSATQVPAGTGPTDVTDVSSTNALVNLTVGEHASLLRPGSTAGGLIAMTELQTEAVSFVLLPSQTAVGITAADLGAVQAPTAPYVQAP